MPEPPSSGGPFELSAPGILEGLCKEAGLNVLKSGQVNCPFSFPDSESFLRGTLSGGPVQGALRSLGENVLKAAVLNAAEPFLQPDGSILIEPNVYIYSVASK